MYIFSSLQHNRIEMSDFGPSPPPPKRMRTRLASAGEPNTLATSAKSSRYLLRSKAKAEGIVVDYIPLNNIPRKRINRFRKLLMLSDDCLLTIFAHMDPLTMSNVAGTCDRLNDLARYTFRVKHNNFGMASLIGSVDGNLSVQMIMKITRGFGDLITSLHLSCSLFGQTNQTSYDLLKLVKKYCPNVKTLELEDFSVSHENMAKLRSMFQSIETLELDSCNFNTSDLGAMAQLKTLKIRNGDYDYARQIFNRNFDKLEEVEFHDLELFRDDTLMEFVIRNPELKRLSIANCESISTNIFSSIGQLKQLEEFEFHQFYRRRTDELFHDDLMQLASIGKLKVLKLNCFGWSVARLLEAFVNRKTPIEHMELVNGLIDQGTCENIKKMKTIKTLRMNEMVGLAEHHVLSFVKELQLLHTLHIKTEARINRFGLKAMVRDGNRLACVKIDSPSLLLDVDTYQNMLATVQKREQHIKLDLTIYGNEHQLTVPESIRKGSNEKWFSVKELNRIYNHIFVRDASPTNDTEDAEIDTDDEEMDDEEVEFPFFAALNESSDEEGEFSDPDSDIEPEQPETQPEPSQPQN